MTSRTSSRGRARGTAVGCALGVLAASGLASCSTILGIQEIQAPGDGGAGAGGGGTGGGAGGAGAGGGGGQAGGGGGQSGGGGGGAQGGGGGPAGGGGGGVAGGGGLAGGGGGAAGGGIGPAGGGGGSPLPDGGRPLDGGILVGCPPCVNGGECCYESDAGAIACDFACPTSDVIACITPSECGGNPAFCCATFTFSQGTTGNCNTESFSTACTASCTSSPPTTCGGTATLRLCSSSTDCASDPSNPICCELTPGISGCAPSGTVGVPCN